MAGARVPLSGRPPSKVAEEVAEAFLRAFHVRTGPGVPLVPQT